MIEDDQIKTRKRADDVENQNFLKNVFPMLVFGVQITAKISDKNQQEAGPAEYVLLQHKECGQHRSHQGHKNLAID